MGVSRRWVEEAVAGLPEDDRPVGRLTLLTALASYLIDQGVIDDFQARHPGDTALIEATAWASFQAVRRISAWLNPPLHEPQRIWERLRGPELPVPVLPLRRDVTALIRGVPNPSSVRGESRPSTWAWTIAARGVIDFRDG